MELTLCGLDCIECPLKDNCGGCRETNGHPFGADFLYMQIKGRSWEK